MTGTVRNVCLVLTMSLGLVASSTASAQTYFLDVSGSPPTVNDAANPVVVNSIPAGTYQVTFIGTGDGGQFDAVNYWGNVTGCDGSGANCSQGWLHRVTCDIPGTGTVTINPIPSIWQTQALALANAPSGLTFTSDAGDLSCWIIDDNYSDNQGGVSMQLDRLPSALEVPTLGLRGMVLLGAALLLGGLWTIRRITG